MPVSLRYSFVVLGIAFLAAGAFGAHAAPPPVTVSPVVIDEEASARDIIKKTVRLTNRSERKIGLYPSVNNVNPEEGKQAFEQAKNADDRKDSLANWIEISRGVIELAPGEEREVTFIIRVNLNAVPGKYHAEISFSEGSTRGEAEARENKAVVTVNLAVADEAKEEIQLLGFITDKFFFSGDDIKFSYQLENIGDKAVSPQGEVRIYNRRGEEVATLEANREGKTFSPNEKGLLASVWSAADGFGQYKALLNLNYGATQRGAVYDTIFFWVIPWKLLAGFLVGGVVGVILIALSFHAWLLRRRHRALAPVFVRGAHPPHGGGAYPAMDAPPSPPGNPHDLTPANASRGLSHSSPTPMGHAPAMPSAGHDARTPAGEKSIVSRAFSLFKRRKRKKRADMPPYATAENRDGHPHYAQRAPVGHSQQFPAQIPHAAASLAPFTCSLRGLGTDAEKQKEAMTVDLKDAPSVQREVKQAGELTVNLKNTP